MKTQAVRRSPRWFAVRTWCRGLCFEDKMEILGAAVFLAMAWGSCLTLYTRSP